MSGVGTQPEHASFALEEGIIAHPGSVEPVPDEVFADSLAHLAALEHEAMLMLAVAYLRRVAPGDAWERDTEVKMRELFPFLPAGTGPGQAGWLLEQAAARIRRMEAASERAGIVLKFNGFCRRRGLGPFERSAVLLLLMQFTAPAFMDAFRRCQFERERRDQFHSDWSDCMEIGTLLSIACGGYGEQVACRRHFSTEGTLFREGLALLEDVGAGTNLLATKVCLCESTVRVILGDPSLYRSSSRFMRRESSTVGLDQVILPEGVKEEIAAAVGNYLDDRASGRLDALDAFFGYGTGMALLFHGPPGTGKTMLARALAARFDRQIITCTTADIGKFHSPETILATIFHEAESRGSIVLLDECDDLFENNSPMSRALLVQLEKSRCVVILATNKPIDLDPAMDRRVAMKVSFPIPGAAMRLKMWQALVPSSLELAPDVDLAVLADRYQLSGGLIKNCIIVAAAFALRGGRGRRITREHLERAAVLQTPVPPDEGSLCSRYAPEPAVTGLQLRSRDKDEILGAARAWQQLKSGGLGLNILISASDVATGVQAAEALARECGLEVRQFDYGRVKSSSETTLLLDPLTQRKVNPLAYAFSDSLGAQALTLFVDHANDLEWMLAGKSGGETNFYLTELTSRLRTHAGLFCMVTHSPKTSVLPVEFHLHFGLEHPPEEAQIRCWEGALGDAGVQEGDLMDLVERWPMHAGEIDFVARQAAILAAIRGCGRPGIQEVLEVIGRHRKAKRSPVLFGGV